MSAWTIIEIQELFFTRAFIMLYILGGGDFIALIIVIILRQGKVGRRLDQARNMKEDNEKIIEDLRGRQPMTTEQSEKLGEAKNRLRGTQAEIALLESIDKNYEMYRFMKV